MTALFRDCVRVHLFKLRELFQNLLILNRVVQLGPCPRATSVVGAEAPGEGQPFYAGFIKT